MEWLVAGLEPTASQFERMRVESAKMLKLRDYVFLKVDAL